MTLSRLLRSVAVGVVAGRFVRGLWASPRLVCSPPSESVTVVVPARDEAERIGPLLAALRGEPTIERVIVVDDGSVDETAAVARAGGAAVVAGVPPPPGWNAKSWAIRQGVLAMTTLADESDAGDPDVGRRVVGSPGDWVVAIDADVVVEPWVPAVAAERADRDGLTLLTLAGRFDVPDSSARWLHSAMLAGLVTRFGPPGTSDRLANGQCLIARRETLLAGLQAVRSAAVEDVALARHVRSVGGRVAFLDAGSAMVVRPYHDIGEVRSGWGRSVGLRHVEPWWRQLIEFAIATVVLPGPFVRLLLRRADAVDLAAFALRSGLLVGMRTAYLDRGVAYWTSPLADLPALTATWWGVVGPAGPWRGRHAPDRAVA